jgi:hypothetical protein
MYPLNRECYTPALYGAYLDPRRSDELERRARSRKIRAEDAPRAQVMLMLANGESFTAISAWFPSHADA